MEHNRETMVAQITDIVKTQIKTQIKTEIKTEIIGELAQELDIKIKHDMAEYIDEHMNKVDISCNVFALAPLCVLSFEATITV